MSRLIELREKKFHEYHAFLNNISSMEPASVTNNYEQNEAAKFYKNVERFELLTEISKKTGMPCRKLPLKMQLIYNLKMNLEYRRPAVRSLSDALATDPVYLFVKGFEGYCLRPTSIIDGMREKEGQPNLSQKLYSAISITAMAKSIALRRSMENVNRYDDSDGPVQSYYNTTNISKQILQMGATIKKSLSHMVMNEQNYNLVKKFTALENRVEAYRLFREYLEDEKHVQ